MLVALGVVQVFCYIKRTGILVGQPTLNRQLRMGTFAALDQRIASRFTIRPMDLAESAAYLRHHLALAGRDEPLFADDAISRLQRVANGLPRALNNAATAALIAAAADSKDLVDDACAKKAVAELTQTDNDRHTPSYSNPDRHHHRRPRPTRPHHPHLGPPVRPPTHPATVGPRHPRSRRPDRHRRQPHPQPLTMLTVSRRLMHTERSRPMFKQRCRQHLEGHHVLRATRRRCAEGNLRHRCQDDGGGSDQSLKAPARGSPN